MLSVGVLFGASHHVRLCRAAVYIPSARRRSPVAVVVAGRYLTNFILVCLHSDCFDLFYFSNIIWAVAILCFKSLLYLYVQSVTDISDGISYSSTIQCASLLSRFLLNFIMNSLLSNFFAQY